MWTSFRIRAFLYPLYNENESGIKLFSFQQKGCPACTNARRNLTCSTMTGYSFVKDENGQPIC
jgi:hypothetical protein